MGGRLAARRRHGRPEAEQHRCGTDRIARREVAVGATMCGVMPEVIRLNRGDPDGIGSDTKKAMKPRHPL
ncbi:hypothetical protein [Burkholderia ambifaria]|uniref:hypothetical protein n=1 Tax=Burkholderia ambifaria TaxID=152480 RepID=UPI0015887A79|nr:hypothetical protein [Burkholderia ambifaria]